MIINTINTGSKKPEKEVLETLKTIEGMLDSINKSME